MAPRVLTSEKRASRGTTTAITKASAKRGFCSITRSGTRGRIPQLPYQEMADAVLGRAYELSIAYVSAERSEELHQQWKHEDGPANILSFPLDESSGEIILHLPTVYARAADFDHTPREHLIFLLIHGMLHLLGHTHGSAMEREERKFFAEFRQK